MIRRRIWRQGNSLVVALPPNYLDCLDVGVDDYIDMELQFFKDHGKFVLIITHPGIKLQTSGLDIVDNIVDKSVN